METIGQRLKYLRETLDLSQQQVANETGVSRGNISNYEKDRVSPAADTIIALCSFFDVSADWLLTGQEHVPEDAGRADISAIQDPGVINLGEEFKKALYMNATKEEEQLILMYRDFSREDKDFIMNMVLFKHEQLKKVEKKSLPSSS
ncbi:Helix-turn-helix domain-containing protein [Paenibacillus sophorae]|uniref:Helix-turn-helix domain-containing protein n=1 Tax=Paenibacillus sophorae TaxID=1333845 RepID=A0A1H8S2A1_9BACL|nr:helix-turn-helix transcriptional regulator [Paenibacillus sophorae]QWU16886.1 helix-turn-helix domain-containing protein [Paenibacillus sophorae]SEO72303.1 Helix-turn-helix domain-containing protein [Paenibacillus sophorae]